MAGSISKEQLIKDLKDFCNKLGKTPTIREMNQYGPHSGKIYQVKFGSWNKALKQAGLGLNEEHNISRQDILEDINRVAEVLGKTPTLPEMDKYGKFSKCTYQSKLDSFVTALEELGLEPSPNQYKFSSQEKPPDLQTTKNVRELRKNGPTPASQIPSSVGISDKKDGLAYFSISTGKSGKPNGIYYLFNEHSPDEVMRKFLEVNPEVTSRRSAKAIKQEVRGYGKEWSKAIDKVLIGQSV